MVFCIFLDCFVSILNFLFLLVVKGDSFFCKELIIEMNYFYDYVVFFVVFLLSI